MESVILANKIASYLDDKKGKDITVININEISSFTDFFVICTGTSNVHVRALADEVQDELKKIGITPLTSGGYRTATWVIMDFGGVFVHVFDDESREFYNIERLWADGVTCRVGQFPAMGNV